MATSLARPSLAADGYGVLAIDPRAPEGPIFQRTTLEELRDEGPFDAALASLALHHVDDLDVALDKLHSLLRRDAPLVIRDFAWDLVDESTAVWDYERLGREGGLAEWRAEHEHLHGFDAMRSALEARFRQRAFAWGPYLSEYEPSAGDAREERRLISPVRSAPSGSSTSAWRRPRRAFVLWKWAAPRRPHPCSCRSAARAAPRWGVAAPLTSPWRPTTSQTDRSTPATAAPAALFCGKRAREKRAGRSGTTWRKRRLVILNRDGWIRADCQGFATIVHLPPVWGPESSDRPRLRVHNALQTLSRQTRRATGDTLTPFLT